MLDIFVATDKMQIEALKLRPRVSLGGPTYWHLHRYFVHADLDPGSYAFLNLYEDTEVSGYQLHRLKAELSEALLDLSAKPETFQVLKGWHGATKSQGSEDWSSVQSDEVRRTILDLLSAIADAEEKGLVLFAIGD